MLVIRFLRRGKKNQPFFKIVVVEKERSPISGLFTEEVGFYNPLTKEKSLKADRIKYWISVGAKPSSTVHNLLVSEKIIEGKKIDVHKKLKKKEDSSDKQEKQEAVQGEPAAEAPAEEKKPAKAPPKEKQAETPPAEKKEEKPEGVKKETAAAAQVLDKGKNSSKGPNSA